MKIKNKNILKIKNKKLYKKIGSFPLINMSGTSSYGWISGGCCNHVCF